MKEHPIIFNTEMVKAILEGRKTQTRRVMKNQNKIINKMRLGWHMFQLSLGKRLFMFKNSPLGIKFPYGNIGDKLWVRETFWINTHLKVNTDRVYYKADGDIDSRCINWRPSIHMPREYARLFLEVIDIRVERIQDITEEDALKEGCKKIDSQDGILATSKENFIHLWNSINKKRGFGWNTNCWVWVIDFKIIGG